MFWFGSYYSHIKKLQRLCFVRNDKTGIDSNSPQTSGFHYQSGVCLTRLNTSCTLAGSFKGLVIIGTTVWGPLDLEESEAANDSRYKENEKLPFQYQIVAVEESNSCRQRLKQKRHFYMWSSNTENPRDKPTPSTENNMIWGRCESMSTLDTMGQLTAPRLTASYPSTNPNSWLAEITGDENIQALALTSETDFENEVQGH